MFWSDSRQNNHIINSGLKWDFELSKRLGNPVYLESYGYKVYSQNDEDGIIQEIFKRIGTTDKRFIEFGVQDGLECNSHYLLHKDWTGLWIEGSEISYEEICTTFKSVIDNLRLKVVNSFITKENINTTFENALFIGEIDLLSIDIDGNDYYIWESIRVVNPRVVIIEYNAKFPPDCEWIMPYRYDYIWDESDKHGASLRSLELLGTKKGYTLVGTNLRGVNAFFVRSDLVGELFPLPANSENLYNTLKMNYSWIAGHPPKYCLVDDDNHINKKLQVVKNMKIVTDNLQSRKVVLWGMGNGQKNIEDVIISYNINNYVYYDSKYNGYNSISNELILSDLSLLTKDKYYVIVSCQNYYPEIEANLHEYGFDKKIDYIYYYH